ncbi:MAG: S24/S26 family peptidase [Terracidiphilus sp.]
MAKETHLQAACCDLAADVALASGSVRLRVTGSSMLPALRAGDLVTVERCSLEEFEPDAMVLFRRGDGLVLHRLVRKTGDSVLTRGDSLPRYDEPVGTSAIVGRAVSVLRNGRPVNLQRTLGQRSVAALLRHSDLCTRLFLRLSARTGQFGTLESTLG